MKVRAYIAAAVTAITVFSATGLAATNGPLKLYSKNNIFFADKNDNPVWLIGVSICCTDAKRHGWPWISKSMIDKVVSHNGNWVHIRTGPFTKEGEGSGWNAYKAVGDKQDLDSWNQSYWDRLRDLVQYARKKGVYVEVDLIDGWVLKKKLSPWVSGNNVNGVNVTGCGSLKDVHKKFLTKVVETVGDLDNVIYQIGNETFGCGITESWARGVASHVKKKMADKGFGYRLISTNSEKSAIEGKDYIDYVNIHDRGGDYIHESKGKPYGNNENVDGISPDKFTDYIWKSLIAGTFYHYWRGENSSGDLDKSYDRMKHFKAFVDDIDFAKMKKIDNTLAGDNGNEYVAYFNRGGSKKIDLSSYDYSFSVSWYNCKTGERKNKSDIDGGKSHSFSPPESGTWALHLQKSSATHARAFRAGNAGPSRAGYCAAVLYDFAGRRVMKTLQQSRKQNRAITTGVYIARDNGNGRLSKRIVR